MGKECFLAEKPSVAADFAKMLGVPKRGRIYENDRYIVSNFVGHLMEIDLESVFPKEAALPILPESRLKMKVSNTAADQFKIVRELMKRDDVDVLYNLCDPDREGESIFRRVYEYVGCKKPVKRIWTQSTTQDAYREAYKKAKAGREYDALDAAAVCRSEADALVGINDSRVLRTPFGRVQTPTLAMVVRAFIANRDFVPKDYFEVHGKFAVQRGEYGGKLLDENNQTAKFDTQEEAVAALSAFQGANPSLIKDEASVSKKYPQLLFDASALQKSAAKKFKFGADKTLSIMQELYENLKCMTYPRSDYRHLPEDMVDGMRQTVQRLGGLGKYCATVEVMLAEDMVRPSKRFFDDSKVGGHYAIVPTGMMKIDGEERPISEFNEAQIKAAMTEDQYKLFDMIVLHTLAAFHPPAEYAVTVRETTVNEQIFKTSGRVLVNQGWLAVYGGQDYDEKDDEKEPALPLLEEGETGRTLSVSSKALKTKAPPLLTEDALLTAMQTAGKSLDDDNLADAMKEKGLGTAATRPSIIAKLQKAAKGKEPYMVRDKKNMKLTPTARGINLIEHLDKYAPQYTDPVITGEWEYKLGLVEQGKYSPADFMYGIRQNVAEFVGLMRQHPLTETAVQNAAVLCSCPACHEGELKATPWAWKCKCGFGIQKEIAGKKLSESAIKNLVTKGVIGELKGFKKKDGSKFDAGLKLEKNPEAAGGMRVSFDFPKRKGGQNAAPAESRETRLDCPYCDNHKLFDEGTRILCKNCKFIVYREISGRPISKKEILDLVTNGETELLGGFTSKAGKPFNARMILDKPNKKWIFSFN